MFNNVILGSGLRANLLSLQNTQVQIGRVQNILSTGLKVNSPLDNPQNYFQAKSLRSASTDLLQLQDGVVQSVQAIKTAGSAVDAIFSLVEQADSILNAAREATASAESGAVITGNVDLSGKSNLTSILGISNTDDIIFEYLNTAGVVTTATIDIGTNESIDQLIAEIKDIGQGGFFNAELTAEGYLKISEVRGKSFNMNFTADANNAAFNAADSALASALGFGTHINATTRNGGVAANANAEISVLASTELVSGVFYEAGGLANGIAESSDLLTNVVSTLGGATARFASAGTPNLTLRINGTTTSANISIAGRTIQGLVDAINTDTNVSPLVNASYNAETGVFKILAVDSSVETVNVTLTTTVAGVPTADFDFGLDPALSPATGIGNAEGETFKLGAAKANLASYENDYNTVLASIDQLVLDANYRGTNLVSGGTLETTFNTERTNKLETKGLDLTAAGLGLNAANFSSIEKINAAAAKIRTALETLNNFGSTISNSLSIIEARGAFIMDKVEIKSEGADKLTVADQNEEGAKLLALDTRQQLGVTALSIAAESQKSVLQLFS